MSNVYILSSKKGLSVPIDIKKSLIVYGKIKIIPATRHHTKLRRLNLRSMLHC